uniref:Uncharacterized protein n=1 Tax=Romanomermis culicivorax TaxID=13658 RepID=A0A915L3W0_ROMCU
MNVEKFICIRIWALYKVMIIGHFQRFMRVCLADIIKRPNVVAFVVGNMTNENEDFTPFYEPDETEHTVLITTIMYVCLAILVLALIAVGIYVTRLTNKKASQTMTERSKTNESVDLAVQEVRLIESQQQLKVLRKGSKSPEEIIRVQSITGGSAKKSKEKSSIIMGSKSKSRSKKEYSPIKRHFGK